MNEQLVITPEAWEGSLQNLLSAFRSFKAATSAFEESYDLPPAVLIPKTQVASVKSALLYVRERLSQITQLEDQLAQSRCELQRLCISTSVFAPINRLSNDVLLNILMHGFQSLKPVMLGMETEEEEDTNPSPTEFRRSVMGVCTRWRSLIMETGMFWASVDTSMEESRIKTLLERSKACPLELEIKSGRFLDGTGGIAGLLTGNLSRCISLSGKTGLIKELSSLLPGTDHNPLPLLRNLSLSGSSTLQMLEFQSLFGSSPAEALQWIECIHLDQVNISSEGIISNLPNLTVLSLKTIRIKPSLLQDILISLPRLDTLVLQDIQFIDDDNDTIHNQNGETASDGQLARSLHIPLLQLHALKLAFCKYKPHVIVQILSWIIAPDLDLVSVQSWEGVSGDDMVLAALQALFSSSSQHVARPDCCITRIFLHNLNLANQSTASTTTFLGQLPHLEKLGFTRCILNATILGTVGHKLPKLSHLRVVNGYASVGVDDLLPIVKARQGAGRPLTRLIMDDWNLTHNRLSELQPFVGEIALRTSK